MAPRGTTARHHGTPVDRRQERLRQDLVDAGVVRELTDFFAEEVLYALYPPVHERLTPLFGAMTETPYADVWEGGKRSVQLPLPFGLPAPLVELWRCADHGIARQAADGHSTFIRSDGAPIRQILSSPERPTELMLSALQFSGGISTVQRTGDGKVKVFLPEAIAIHEKNAWELKPYARAMAWPLQRKGEPSAQALVLDLAIHILSPSNVGATLVLLLADEASSSAVFDRSAASSIPPLELSNPLSLQMVRSICAQNDRAVIFDSGGAMTEIGVALRAGAVPIVVEGGTRHNSAANASRTERRAMFVVVSTDGPVSVFFEGRKIASFKFGEWSHPCPDCFGSGLSPNNQDQCSECVGEGEIRSMHNITTPPRFDVRGRRWKQPQAECLF